MALIVGDEFANTLYGTAGNDRIEGLGGDDILYGGLELDGTFDPRESDGSDRLYGGDGNDTLRFGNGLNGIGGNYANGGDGFDTVSIALGDNLDGWYVGLTPDIFYSNINLPKVTMDEVELVSISLGRYEDWLTVNGNVNTVVFGGSGIDTLVGGSGQDRFYGGSDGDMLWGNNGYDELFGDGGSDELVGGRGLDRLTGGTGNDRFIWNTPEEARDRITDFAAGADKLVFDSAGFDDIASINATNFASNAFGVALNPDVRFLWSERTGGLFYDPDGNGSAAKILIAHIDFSIGSTITTNDMLLI